jgi:formylglycine-generating enzyme required for sulfatase activity
VHVKLDSNAANHSSGSPLEVQGVKDSVGVFLRRQNAGLGNISAVACTLRMEKLGSANYDFQVFGIEMVWVPEGNFYLGDGTSGATFRDGTSTDPFLVTTEGSIAVGATAGQLNATANAPAATLPAAFPKGHRGFYTMKYELSQGQYAAFLNTLASDQCAARYAAQTTLRHNLSGIWPNITSTTPHRAMGFLSWQDLQAYLDWSGLRPMTELEYEKAVRGPAFPVNGGYAWATSTIFDVNTLVNDGADNETISGAVTPGSGAANYYGGSNSPTGPFRVGFPAGAATDRLQAGASYYGVMEMTGNIMEQVVSTHNAAGLAYTGNHGDGEISVSPSPGFANVAGWNNNSVEYYMMRGGAYHSNAANCRASHRAIVNNANPAVNMSNTTVLVSSALDFYDSGGPAGNYGNCVDLTIVFTSTCNSPLRITFNSATINGTSNGGCAANDRITIYDNNAASGTILYGPGVSPSGAYVSTNSSNSIAVRFYSDGATVAAGWDADVANVYGNCFQVNTRRANCGGRGVRHFW